MSQKTSAKIKKGKGYLQFQWTILKLCQRGQDLQLTCTYKNYDSSVALVKIFFHITKQKKNLEDYAGGSAELSYEK